MYGYDIFYALGTIILMGTVFLMQWYGIFNDMGTIFLTMDMLFLIKWIRSIRLGTVYLYLWVRPFFFVLYYGYGIFDGSHLMGTVYLNGYGKKK